MDRFIVGTAGQTHKKTLKNNKSLVKNQVTNNASEQRTEKTETIFKKSGNFTKPGDDFALWAENDFIHRVRVPF
jgi:hypothetical protein